jgi:hypothetical protein
MNNSRWLEIVDTVHDSLLDSVYPCDNEEPISKEEFDMVISVLLNNVPFGGKDVN